MEFFEYAAQVLIREKTALLKMAKECPHIEDREKYFKEINLLDISIEFLLRETEK